jgi:hypothetical protein
MKVPINPDHHAVTTVLSIEAGVSDLVHHHQSITTARGTKEPKDPSLPNKCTTTKMMKRRWERRALLAEFAEPPYLKDSNYPMTSRNMMGPRSHNHGSDYLQAVRILGGSNETAMQSL